MTERPEWPRNGQEMKSGEHQSIHGSLCQSPHKGKRGQNIQD